MPTKKRKSSTAGKMTTKKPKTKAPAVAIPGRRKSATTRGSNRLISSDPLYPGKGRKSNTELIVLSSDREEEFYSSGTGNFAASPVQQNLTKLFDSYRDQPKPNPDKILIDGAQKYLSDLSIALEEVVHLALCDLLSCPSIGEFDREGFVSGWTAASTPTSNNENASYVPSKPLDSISRQREYISALRRRLQTDPVYFKSVYRSSFKLAKSNESSRSVPLDAAIEFWKMFFSSSTGGIEWNSKDTRWLDLWCEFYNTQGKRPVNKDLWNMVGELVQKIKEPGGESLDWWTEDGAWPMAVDDFVAWVKEKRKTEADNEMDTS